MLKIRKIPFIVCALFFGGVGALIALLTVVVLIDPVGSKMADDSDPFGNPYISWEVHLASFAVSIACFSTSYYFVKKL
jgi:hypothetical protein